MYPLDLMQQVINFLQKDHLIFLFGAGVKEKQRLEVWEKAYKNVYSTAGKINLKDQLNLMSYLDSCGYCNLRGGYVHLRMVYHQIILLVSCV